MADKEFGRKDQIDSASGQILKICKQVEKDKRGENRQLGQVKKLPS